MTHIVDERYTQHGDGRLLHESNLLSGRGEGERIWRRRTGALSHRMHAAWDIPGPEGTPVRAVLSGEVVWSGMIAGYGHTVILLHRAPPATEAACGDMPLTTAYCHLDAEDVTLGAQVAAGAQIGRMGATNWDLLGRVGGVHREISPHLHFSAQLVEPHPVRRYPDRWRDPSGWRPSPHNRPRQMMGEYEDGNLLVHTRRRGQIILCRGFSSAYEEDWSRQVEPVSWLREIYGAGWREYRTTLGRRDENETPAERRAAARARRRRFRGRLP